ncbi:MAG: type III pantothenate kinase [Sphingobacteriaceae bacterium]
MNNLVIDIGNSLVKLAVFTDQNLVIKETWGEINLNRIRQWLSQYHIQNSIISTVAAEVAELEELLQNSTSYIRFSNQTELPIQNHYQSKETLGLDRLAALMGARYVCPKQNCFIIDAGTCITYDFLNDQQAYYGGSISPGIQMRLKALNAFTDKLPLVALDENYTDLVGVDTRTSILSGVINGLLSEVSGMIQKYQQQYPEMQILLCGGDANFFDTRLKNSIFAHNFSLMPHLVLIGLNEVIHHQYDQ